VLQFLQGGMGKKRLTALGVWEPFSFHNSSVFCVMDVSSKELGSKICFKVS